MSHSIGAVLFDDGKLLYYEYNGTTDVPISHLYETMDEVEEDWRKGKWLDCICMNDEPVRIMTTYGGGFAWDGRACRTCKAITDGFEPFSAENYEDTEPVWSPWIDAPIHRQRQITA